MWALVAAVCLAIPEADAGFDRDDALGYYQRRPCDQIDNWPTGDGLPQSACTLLVEEPLPEHFDEAVQRVARAWNVPREVADALLTTEVFREAVYHQRMPEGWATARYSTALAAAPSSPAVLAALVAGQEHGATEQQLDDALGASPSLAKAVLSAAQGPARVNIEAFILAQDPSAIPLPAKFPELWPLVAPLSFKLQRLRHALAEKEPPAGLPELYRMVLADALDAGLDAFAVDLWRRCPAAFTAEVLRDHRELALALAVAAIGVGDSRLSTSLVPRVTPPVWPLPSSPDELGLINVADCFGPHDCRRPILEEALARLRDPKRAARDSLAFIGAIDDCYRGPPLSVPLARLLRDHPEAARGRLKMSPRNGVLRDRLLPTRAAAFVGPASEELARVRAQVAQTIARSRAEDTANESR